MYNIITYSKTEGGDWRWEESLYHDVGAHQFQKIKAEVKLAICVGWNVVSEQVSAAI